MNRISSYILYIGLISLITISCDKEGIMKYDRERAAIEFNGSSYAYSFKKTSKAVDTVNIPFNLVGYPEDWERHAGFTIIKDSTTATPNDYQVIDAVMEAGAYHGKLKVRVENKTGDNFKDVRVYFEIAHSKDFIPGLDEKKNYFLYLTNKLVRPVRWEENGWKERYFLGTYSTAYYQFIIEVSGETEFPYPWAVPGYNDDKQWNPAEKDAFLSKIKNELKIRNQREGSPLLHDDGPAKGKEVVVGKYY